MYQKNNMIEESERDVLKTFLQSLKEVSQIFFEMPNR